MSESKFKAAKKEVVLEIVDKIQSSQAVAFAEYRGLTVSELEEFRKEAKKLGVEIKVFKNRLFKLAAEQTGFGDLDQYLVGPNIFAFSTNDDMSAAKLLVKFAKAHKLMVLKAGTYEGQVIDAAGIKQVASLPTYEEALGILARSMMAPLQQISLSLKLVSEGKTE
ncbi:50S ribosomal protein L10 [Mycoplasma nasistruthionis]|uniref:Large ribosomal subunit protein uL10 n=1 Tax=Mycoplasma nasistruthionis TaxID=353852 RepID=A0A4Y6I5F1_9MOLU|nr:50S ribosomal protein L10 [Mycoplasma nasistruthionis]QCZ36552.1 50S ribosomal protein L10 [Mycoplasma nasistruthionis]QDF64845.1 50S ribosomal protein L10 [Mycoplasma nasistruthionis]